MRVVWELGSRKPGPISWFGSDIVCDNADIPLQTNCDNADLPLQNNIYPTNSNLSPLLDLSRSSYGFVDSGHAVYPTPEVPTQIGRPISTRSIVSLKFLARRRSAFRAALATARPMEF